MSNEARIQIEGNVARDPETRQAAGKSVTGITVLVTGRKKQGDDWVDGETVAYECTLWGDEAENAVASLPKGTAVLVVGRLVGVDTYESQGETRVKLKVAVENIGPSLKRATAQVTRLSRGQRPGLLPGHVMERLTDLDGEISYKPQAEPVWGAPGASYDETPVF